MDSAVKKSSEQLRAEAEILRFHDRLGPFVTAAESTRMPMVFTNTKSVANPIIFANGSFVELFGYSREELLGRDFTFLAARDVDHERIVGERNQFDGAVHNDLEALFRRKDGSQFWGALFASPVRNRAGKVVQHFVSVINLTKFKQADEALQFSERRLRMAMTAAKLGIADIDLLTHKEHWSIEMREILGTPDAPASPKTYLSLVHPDDLSLVKDLHIRSLRGEAIEGEESQYRIVRDSDHAVRWIASERHAMRDASGTVIRLVVTNRDITESKAEHDRVVWTARHDMVTGLPNRAYFRAELETALAAALAEDTRVALLLIDLDRFKHINDLLGHQAGDDALSAFAGRLDKALPQSATLARLGGDEFAAILPLADATAALAIADGLLRRLDAPFSIGGRNLDLHASIGVSIFPRHGRGASQLTHSADLALYSAKKAGGARAHVFTPELRAEREKQLSMLQHARLVLENRWIEPFYQPKILLATGGIAGFEALLRWRHPSAGLQLPRSIAYAFDDIHLAGLLGAAMTEAVLTDMRRWMDRGTATGKIAMNASAAELRDPAYAERLLARLEKHRIPASLLELEITETAFLDERASSVLTVLRTLRAHGMTVALDDFGTGFSSLTHIRDFPVDTIKIDSSFIAGLDDGTRDRAITEAVLVLGAALGMTTVAEGVETQAQADFLTSHGCLLAQGFLYAPALEAAEVERRLSSPN